jgi:hypothetical protein
MIIRENNNEAILIEQHEHALISGQFVYHWNRNAFLRPDLKSSVEYAVTNHDRSWIPLDRKPVLLKDNDLASFINYPLRKKLQAYKDGVSQLVEEDIYAGYLISRHYASFFKGKKDILGNEFMEEEKERQEKLKQVAAFRELNLSEEEKEFHFDLLQLCDNLSLYVCMNEWGAGKEKEVQWFRDGFPQKLTPFNSRQFYAQWVSETEVKLDPYPFTAERVYMSIPYKRLTIKDIKNGDLQQLYREIPYDYHPVSFTV